ncbi:MAG TPA: LysM peptidoglycan-binding domain-containing protein, partial [Candidatus Moranbacteria bacterium]|nr:LysM peptidoglycan-binding domain-containing protein [Candidatus Moranbacteria bacterium]
IHTPGTYILTYSVTDLAGNAATPITRTITVHDAIEEEPIQQDPEMSDVAVETPACAKTKPGKPKNITADSTTDSRILVAFKKASGDVDRYQMKYGETPDANDKKIKNIHKERRDYTINDLTPGTTYYIKVRAVNECVQGSWSRAIKIKTPPLANKTKDLNLVEQNSLLTKPSLDSTSLITTDSEKTLSPNEQISENDCSYIIQSGDTLNKIAKEKLGEVNRYQEIIELNKENHPSLSQRLNIGQEIALPCEKELRDNPENSELINEKNTIDEVKIKVINQEGQPLKNIKVILYSEPQETLTNDEGIATFFNVIPGENRIVVQGEKEQTELNVNLTENKNMNGDNDFIVTIKEQNNWLI